MFESLPEVLTKNVTASVQDEANMRANNRAIADRLGAIFSALTTNQLLISGVSNYIFPNSCLSTLLVIDSSEGD